MTNDMKRLSATDGAGEADNWITVENGEHVLVEDGQTKVEAISKHFEKTKDGVKEQVQKAASELSATNVLMEIDSSAIGSNYLELVKRVQDKLAKEKGVVKRAGFGDIQVGARLMDAKRYFKSNNIEQAAVLAVPTIIENGRQLGCHEDHKNRGYPTYTFAGKISIQGREGIMAVIVTKTTKNFYKVHRVLTPDGKTLEIEKTTD